MKYAFALLCGLWFVSASSQDLYLKLSAVNAQQDSLLSQWSPKNTFKDYTSLKKASEEIIDKLMAEGYLNMRTDKLNAINDSVYQLNLNLREKYKLVYLKNYTAYPKVFENKSPYIEIKELPSTLYAVLNELSKEGKPFSQIKLEDINTSVGDTISAKMVLYESNLRTLDEINISGYDKFPKAFLKNYTNLKTGVIFNREKLVEQSEKLDELTFAKQTKTAQVQFSQDSTALYLYLERSTANSFDGFIGFNNTDENDFQLNGNIDLNLVNNFHGGEEINLNYKNDGNAQEWFDVGIRLPYIFKTRFSFDAGLGFFKQDSTFSNNTQRLKLDYQISQDINLGLTAAFENSRNLLDDNQNNDIQDFQKSRYGIEAVYGKSKRYSKLFLSNQFVNLSFGLGQRQTDDLDESQQYIKLKLRHIFKLHKRQYIYIGQNTGFLNSDRFFSNELFRFGGINSMRGFAENRFFANFYGTIQTEYRYILGSNLYIHSVLDYGFYQNDVDRFNENLYSFGVGFGLETQAGILRLIFANGGSDTQNIEFKNTQIHLKFLSVF